MSNATKFKDIFVAVHGIGAQSRFATVRSVAARLATSKALLGSCQSSLVVEQPLGFFHSDVRNLTSITLVDDEASLKGADLASIGFSEVFWADIPQEVVKEGRTLEETKAWARTVMARANALCANAKATGKTWIVPPDFSLAGEVLDEIIDTVYVLENLFFLADKAGLFKFDLRRVLEEYLGDVQLVAEFTYYRTDIVGRFHQAMSSIYAQQLERGNPDVRIHIVAHSEGTVVSFLGLLHAMSGQQLSPADPGRGLEARMDSAPIPDWLKHVAGFMTIGSPIDKHILLWRRLWNDLQPRQANEIFRRQPIRWRNYYDYGDPVGFKLDSARLWLHHVGCKAFQFCGCPKCHHDIGFARYLFPGEAHNEYWNDSEVFEHFIKDVVKPDPKAPRPKPPGDKRLIALASPVFPYVLSFLLLLGGVFVVYKATHAYTHPRLDPLQKFVLFTRLGIKPIADISGWDLLGAVLGTAALIAGATLLARFPLLAIGRRWQSLSRPSLAGLAERFPRMAASPTWTLVGFAAFLTGCVLYGLLVPREIRAEIGGSFEYLGTHGPTLGILGLTAIAGMSGYLVMSRGLSGTHRRQRWLWKGMRPLILCGALAVALIVVLQLVPRDPLRHLDLTIAQRNSLTPQDIKVIRESRLSAGELNQLISIRDATTNWIATLDKATPVLATHPPTWPVVVSGVAFLYLWWLATLVFDLVFVWQRYVRGSTANDRLREWNSYGFSPRWDGPDQEPCSNAESVPSQSKA